MTTPRHESDDQRTQLLGALRFNLNIDRHRLADAGDRFGGWSKHQVEIMPRDRIARHRPARPSSFVNCREQFHVKRHRLGRAMHR
jgi:hypothetical protein